MAQANWRVIGFDRRLLPFMTTFRFSVADIRSSLVETVRWGRPTPPFPASRSPEVWPRAINVDEIPSSQLNEFNLLHLPEEAAEASVTVAFAVDQSVLDCWTREPYALTIAELYLSPERGWRTLGYDVTSSELQISALYDTHTLKPAVVEALGVGNDLLNRFGLIPGLELATALKQHLDVAAPDLAYFEVVKVFVKLDTPV